MVIVERCVYTSIYLMPLKVLYCMCLFVCYFWSILLKHIIEAHIYIIWCWFVWKCLATDKNVVLLVCFWPMKGDLIMVILIPLLDLELLTDGHIKLVYDIILPECAITTLFNSLTKIYCMQNCDVVVTIFIQNINRGI